MLSILMKYILLSVINNFVKQNVNIFISLKEILFITRFLISVINAFITCAGNIVDDRI